MTTTLQEIVNVATTSILQDWRQTTQTDDAILRDKLMECGWKYRRTNGGGWYHPEAPGNPPPRTLEDLARNLAAHIVQEEFNK